MKKATLSIFISLLFFTLIIAYPKPAQAQIAVPEIISQVANFFLGTRQEIQVQPQESRPQFLYNPEVVISQPVAGDLIVAGGRVDIQAPINGDLIVAAGLLQINAPISGEVHAITGLSNLNAKMSDDVRLAGLAVNISSEINDDSMLAAVFLRQAVASRINGSLLAVAYKAWLNGVIGGDLWLEAQDVEFDGGVGGSVRISANNLKVLPNALVLENLSGSLKSEPTIDPAAQLKGDVQLEIIQEATASASEASESASQATMSGSIENPEPNQPDLSQPDQQSWLPGWSLVSQVSAVESDPQAINSTTDLSEKSRIEWKEFRARASSFFGGVLVTFIGGAVILWLLPNYQRGMVRTLQTKTSQTAMVGILWISSGIVASILLMITVIGIPLGVIVLLLWIINMIMAPWAVAQAVGSFVSKNWQNKLEIMKNEYMHLLIGAFGLAILTNLPFVGWIMIMIVWTMGMGSALYWLFNRSAMVKAEVESIKTQCQCGCAEENNSAEEAKMNEKSENGEQNELEKFTLSEKSAQNQSELANFASEDATGKSAGKEKITSAKNSNNDTQSADVAMKSSEKSTKKAGRKKKST